MLSYLIWSYLVISNLRLLLSLSLCCHVFSYLIIILSFFLLAYLFLYLCFIMYVIIFYLIRNDYACKSSQDMVGLEACEESIPLSPAPEADALSIRPTALCVTLQCAEFAVLCPPCSTSGSGPVSAASRAPKGWCCRGKGQMKHQPGPNAVFGGTGNVLLHLNFTRYPPAHPTILLFPVPIQEGQWLMTGGPLACRWVRTAAGWLSFWVVRACAWCWPTVKLLC